MPPRPSCRHCRTNASSQSRGLCQRCYADRAIRALYPLPANNGQARLPTVCQGKLRVPTASLPGTTLRVEAYAQRALLGLSLFHPDDAHHPLP